ncbi:MAG: class I SAM-dependent methyltransferase [Acidobacteriota bacterium]
MTLDEAITHLRSQPEHWQLIHDAYLGEDVFEAAVRFEASEEFSEVMRLSEGRVNGGTVLDLGAGTGIASYAFARNEAALVYALEPDPSKMVGRGAIERLKDVARITVLEAAAESIPLEDESVDVVYARQVLHHIRDLGKAIDECYRVLRRGGMFIASREHVLRSEEERRVFLEEHPLHKLVGNENAYYLGEYVSAIRQSRLRLRRVFGPWGSVINTFPGAVSEDDLSRLARDFLARRFGRLGYRAARFAWVRQAALRVFGDDTPPGRLYTFVAVK